MNNQTFKNIIVLIFYFTSVFTYSNNTHLGLDSLIKSRTIDENHASLFSKVLTLDNDGRIKPFHSYASEILRKLSRKEEIYSQNSTQIVLGMGVDPLLWQMVPIIKVSNSDLLKLLNKEGPLLPFVSFFDVNNYILTPYVESAYSKRPIDRTKFDKAIIDVDERVNICSMIFSDQLIKIFPNNQEVWSFDVSMEIPGLDSLKTKSFKNIYRDLVFSAFEDNMWEDANLIIKYIHREQDKYASDVLPSVFKINLEILYNNLKPFGWTRLFLAYFVLGFLLLVLLLLFFCSGPPAGARWRVRSFAAVSQIYYTFIVCQLMPASDFL